jgi:hypothetical protein
MVANFVIFQKKKLCSFGHVLFKYKHGKNKFSSYSRFFVFVVKISSLKMKYYVGVYSLSAFLGLYF